MTKLVERGFNRTQRLYESRSNMEFILGSQPGVVFSGTISRPGQIELTTDLGDDPRGRATLEIKKVNAPALNSQGIISDLDTGEKWRLVKQVFDCPSYSLKFNLELIAPCDT